jgi:hypothetical protein
VLLRPIDDAVEVLGQQVTPSNQIHHRTSNSLKVVIDASISLFDGQARIASGLSCRPSRREGYVRPQELVDLARISNRWIPEIPASGRRQWYRNFRVTDTAKVVSISIHLWHEMRKGRDFSPLVRAGPWIVRGLATPRSEGNTLRSIGTKVLSLIRGYWLIGGGVPSAATGATLGATRA